MKELNWDCSKMGNDIQSKIYNLESQEMYTEAFYSYYFKVEYLAREVIKNGKAKIYSENLKLSDYDGYGEYVNDDGTLSGINIYPSDISDGKIRNDFNKIAWFNR